MALALSCLPSGKLHRHRWAAFENPWAVQIAGLFTSSVWEVGKSEILELQAIDNFTPPNLPI